METVTDRDPIVVTCHELIDGTGRPAQQDVALLISGGIIRDIASRTSFAVPERARVMDLSNLTVMPGIVDAHMHFFGVPGDKLYTLPTESEAYRALVAAGEAKEMLEAGITTARCLGSSISPSLRRAINEGHIPGPRIMAAGEFICSTSGTWDHISFPLEWIKAKGMLADGTDGMREIVRRRYREGANVIKIGLSKGRTDDTNHPWGDDPYNQVASYSPEEINALTQEAHLNRLKVSAHCIGDEAVVAALKGGVDVIEHGYAISDDTRKWLVDANIIVVSTISQLYFHNIGADRFHYSDWLKKVFLKHTDAMRADFEKGLKTGVRYALGSDLTGKPTHPLRLATKEFELAVQWGMDPMQAIQAGTRVSAEALGLDNAIGTIEKGKLADLIGVSGDPLRNVALLQDVRFVMKEGKVIVDRGRL